MARLPEDTASIFLAFNKSIAEELKSRGVNARTFHSLVFSPVMRAKNQRNPNMDKLRDLQSTLFSEEEGRMYGAFARKLVGLAKQTGIGCLCGDEETEWFDIVDHHDMELEHENADVYTAVALSRKLFHASLKSREVDFDDMLYFAVKDGISLPKFDWVFVDEAQDTNAIQRAILRKIMREGSRLVAVGDPAQAIYGFRGADSDSLGLIAEEFQAETLPLSVSYRCASSIVEFARNWVSHIQPAPGAPEGAVTTVPVWGPKSFEATDLVVCRTTKPLIALGYKMLRDRVAVRILGREIGEGLVKLIDKQKAKGIDKLVDKLSSFRDREVEKARAKGNESKAAAVADKVDAILCLVESLDENNRTIPELVRVIRALFEDAKNCTTLCTIHKAKGLEADRVYWLNSSQCPSKWARQAWQKQQERNLCYVAATRAKSALVLIEEEGCI
jgi:superfamily I DNA/RNA helicase